MDSGHPQIQTSYIAVLWRRDVYVLKGLPQGVLLLLPLQTVLGGKNFYQYFIRYRNSDNVPEFPVQ
jgi:hypothetical protein